MNRLNKSLYGILFFLIINTGVFMNTYANDNLLVVNNIFYLKRTIKKINVDK